MYICFLYACARIQVILRLERPDQSGTFAFCTRLLRIFYCDYCIVLLRVGFPLLLLLSATTLFNCPRSCVNIYFARK